MEHDVTIIPIFSDIHVGGKTALMPPGTRTDANGVGHTPSKQQRKLWRQWIEGWELARDIASEYKKPRYVVISNGDEIDGDHHSTDEIWTKDLPYQARVSGECITKGLDIISFDPARDKAYMTEGTETHVGLGHVYSNDIACDLEVFEAYSKGRYVWPQLRLTISGVNIFAAHHGGSVGRLPWTRTNGASNIAKAIYFEAVDNKPTLPIPDWSFFAHLHQLSRGTYHGNLHQVEVVSMPSYQLPTHFVNMIAARKAFSDIGNPVLVVEANGQSYLKMSMSKVKLNPYKEI